jgi:hypothetical protein
MDKSKDDKMMFTNKRLFNVGLHKSPEPNTGRKSRNLKGLPKINTANSQLGTQSIDRMMLGIPNEANTSKNTKDQDNILQMYKT